MHKAIKVLLTILTVALIAIVYALSTAKPSEATVVRHAEIKTVIVLEGKITKNTIDELKKEFTKKPYNVIMATSSGGDYQTGIDMAKFVGQKRITVYVPEYCHSACSFMAMTTPKLVMSRKATIGIHNITLEPGDGQDPEQKITLRTALKFAETSSTYSAQMFSLYATAGIPGVILMDAAHKRGNEIVHLTYPQLHRWGIAILDEDL